EKGKNPGHTGGGGRFSSKGPPAILRALAYGLAVLALIILTATATSFALRKYKTGQVRSIENRLGSWCLPRPTGGSTRDLDFSAVPVDRPQALGDVFLLRSSTSGSEPPSLRKDTGRLSWVSYPDPIAFSYPFRQLDEIQLSFDRPEGRSDLAVSIVDPLGNRRRSLTLRLSPGRKTSEPLEALRHGDKVIPQAPVPPIPALNSKDAVYKVFLELKPGQDKTSVTIKVIELTGNQVLYSHNCELDGNDWASGAVVLQTSFYRKPCTFEFRKFLLSGTLEGTRLKEVPWQD
ncbi:MAG: hypothetical protein MK133_06705, partial [Planctomycetes bacterium]|nr:hypothetical protein [Planctomycetota bacterium]